MKNKNAKAEDKQVSFTRIFNDFRRIAHTNGDGSKVAKESIMTGILRDCKNDEAKYAVRFLQKTLKTGAAYAFVVSGLARAFINSPPNKENCNN